MSADFFGSAETLLYARFQVFSKNQVLAGISGAGLGVICFVFGAFVMHSDVPIMTFARDFLKDAFEGGEAAMRHGFGRPEIAEGKSGASLDKADRTFDGFTLCATSQGSRAVLLDMAGNQVHRWVLPYSKAWSPDHPPPVKEPFPDNQIYWNRPGSSTPTAICWRFMPPSTIIPMATAWSKSTRIRS